MNVFAFAIKMEQDGKTFYEKLASRTTLPGLKKIFSSLAEDEQKHCDIFMALQEETQNVFMADSSVLQQSRNVFESLLNEGGHVAIKSDLESYRYAMQVEEESFRLYEEAADREENEAVKSILLKIAGEEHQHFQIMENVYAFVNAPNQYLAWGEFSNLEGFRNFGRDTDR